MTQQPNSPAVGCFVACLLSIPLDVALIALAIAHPVWLLAGFGVVVLALIVLRAVRKR